MKKDQITIFFLSLIILIVWHSAFINFFAQDDFILINQFSQNNLWQDIKNVFGLPQVTHWRPLHNFYFFIGGNIFGQNYVGYHALTFILHIGASFLIYKTVLFLIKNRQAAMLAGLHYSVHPSHFVSLFWISGAATTAGFFFLIAAFYGYLINKQNLALILFTTSLLASESMLAGFGIFVGLAILKNLSKADKAFIIKLTAISAIFVVVRLSTLTTKTTFAVYQLELSTRIFEAIRYYILRILGFSEVGSDLIPSLILLSWLGILGVFAIKMFIAKRVTGPVLLGLAVVILGLFPFILIPSHLSPHYMNISIFGFAILVALVLKEQRPKVAVAVFLIFTVVAIFNINLIGKDNWVIKRSNLVRLYLEKINRESPDVGSTIVFADSQLSTSEETYIALGQGEAIDFWFSEKNYKKCFAFIEDCENKVKTNGESKTEIGTKIIPQ